MREEERVEGIREETYVRNPRGRRFLRLWFKCYGLIYFLLLMLSAKRIMQRLQTHLYIYIYIYMYVQLSLIHPLLSFFSSFRRPSCIPLVHSLINRHIHMYSPVHPPSYHFEKAINKQLVTVNPKAPAKVDKFLLPLISPNTTTPHNDATNPGVDVIIGKVTDKEVSF